MPKSIKSVVRQSRKMHELKTTRVKSTSFLLRGNIFFKYQQICCFKSFLNISKYVGLRYF